MAAEAKHHELYDALCGIVGPKYVTDDQYALYCYCTDTDLWDPLVRRLMPGIIARPSTTDEISSIVKLANRTHIPVVPRGGFATVGGATEGEAGRHIILDLSRMTKVLDINEDNMTATIEAGIPCTKAEVIIKERTNGKFEAHGAWMPGRTVSWAGWITGSSCCQGAYPDFLTGKLASDDVVGMKVVLPNGDILQTGLGPGVNVYQPEIYSGRVSPGPNLNWLFFGDFGTLGIKTEITIKLHPTPKVKKTGSFLFDSMEKLFRAEFEITRHDPPVHNGMFGVLPTMFKLVGIPIEKHGMAYSVWGSVPEECEVREKIIREICAKYGEPGNEMSDALAYGLFGDPSMKGGMRDMASTFNRGTLAGADCIMPVDRFLEELPGIEKKVEEWGPRARELGVPGLDHFEIVDNSIAYYAIDYIYDGSNPEETELARDATVDVVKYLVKHGGTPWASSGIYGKVNREALSSPYLNLLRTVKKALDPNNILNPNSTMIGV